MDEINNDIVNAQQKENEAAQLRKMEYNNKDDANVVTNMEASARELDQEAANLRQDADNITAEQKAAEETEE